MIKDGFVLFTLDPQPRTLHATLPAIPRCSRWRFTTPHPSVSPFFVSRPLALSISRHAPCNPALFASRPCALPSSHISTHRSAPSIIAAPRIAECAAIFGQIDRVAGCQSINRKVARRFFLGKCQAVTMQARPSGPVRPNPDADLPIISGRPEKLSKNQGLTRSCTLHTANSAGKTSFMCLPNAGGE